MSRAVTIWKGLIALRQSTDAFRLKSLQDIKDRVHLITVPGQNGVEKEDVVIGYQITAPMGISTQSLSMRMKKPANLIWELPLPTSEMLKFWQMKTKQDQSELPTLKGWNGLKKA